MAQAIRAACRESEGQAEACPHCRSRLLQSESTERRVRLGQFGRAEVMVHRLHCEGRGARFRPAERFLACLQGGDLTRTLREAGALAGASRPCATAARLLVRDGRGAPYLRKLRTRANTDGRSHAADRPG